jgi:deferrochelatase/peroxidase EfeB
VRERHYIPIGWTPLWWAKHLPTGTEYRIGDTLDRGDHFNEHARFSVITQLFRTPGQWVVAAVKYPDGVLGTLGLHTGSHPEHSWEVDSDIRAERGDCKCAFCGRTIAVHICNNRKRDKCPCGARHFFRRVRQGGNVVAEQEGWRKDGKEIVRC